ncbi:MAG: VCBS repeat-containing protein [Chthoniobacter sp.]|nr:VCBS repeat-containing protein [Chthoniobacter sp.]
MIAASQNPSAQPGSTGFQPVASGILPDAHGACARPAICIPAHTLNPPAGSPRSTFTAILAVLLICLVLPARAYMEAPFSLGKVITDSTNILVARVEKVDREKNLIIFTKVADLKGKHPADTIKHNIGQAGFNPREWQNVMAWAEVGQTAVIFHNGGASEICIKDYWYQCGIGEWWQMVHGEPYLLRSFCGKPEKLITAVTAILAGQEVTVPAMVDGDKMTLQLRTARLQRVKASLAIQDYNATRDFAGWGVEDLRPLAGMPGFQQYAALNRTSPGAAGVAPADFDGDGKMDLCLFGSAKVVLLQNAGGSLNEVPLAVTGGARAAAWADYNGDGKPDLLLATPSGARLFTNAGGTFKDDTASLPVAAYSNLTAAAWLDYDGDGKPDILLADGFNGLRLYHNTGATPPKFDDVSDKVGLGRDGLARGLKGDALALADVDGDGRTDFLYSAGNGVLALNKKDGFAEAKDSGLAFRAGQITPVFGDFDGDKAPDVFVPQSGGSKLFRNDGKGHFTDITAKSGALAAFTGDAACAVWTDFNNRGKLDLIVGCLRGPNRYFRHTGNGTFADATEEIGFLQRIFNTRALAAIDLNKDGVLDLILNNEGQESSVLIGDPQRVAGPAVAKQ